MMKEKNKKTRKIFWGTMFIAVALLIVLDALKIVPELPFIRITLGILCVSWAFKELASLKFHGAVFPIAGIFILFEKEIARLFDREPDLISNWVILVVAVLLTVGIKLIFGGIGGNYRGYSGNVDMRYTAKTEKNSFSSKAFYIDCAELRYEIIKNSFGKSEIYLQNPEIYDGGGIIEVNNDFGCIEMYIPSDWNVMSDIHSAFGTVENSCAMVGGSKNLIVRGQNNFGVVKIIRR